MFEVVHRDVSYQFGNCSSTAMLPFGIFTLLVDKMSNCDMAYKSIKDIRRENFAHIVQSVFKKERAELAAKLECQVGLISRMLNGNKGIGDAMARKIEMAAGTEKFWLDNVHYEEDFSLAVMKAASEMLSQAASALAPKIPAVAPQPNAANDPEAAEEQKVEKKNDNHIDFPGHVQEVFPAQGRKFRPKQEKQLLKTPLSDSEEKKKK